MNFYSTIYKIFIDPLLSKLHRGILEYIKTSDKVIDVACGTGSLSLAISNKARSVMGIDLSEEMIGTARRSANKRHVCNAGFMVLDASDMKILRNNEFDIAVTSMALHQFDPEIAIKALSEMKRIASRIIIADYNCPLPGGFREKIVRSLEKMAGEEHNSNFRTYISNGGMDRIIIASGLVVTYRVIKGKGIFNISVCEKEN